MVLQICIICIICKICKICKTCPAFLGPWYSCSTEKNAHSCCCIPVSVFVWILNSSSSLQNQMLSILSWKAPSEIPGGLINIISWRFVCCNFFGTNGHEDIRILPWCFVCPIKRVENKQYNPGWCWMHEDAECPAVPYSVQHMLVKCAKYAKYVCRYTLFHIYA